MTQYHKHKGVESKGVLKSHPVEQQHKDPKVQRWHDEAVGGTLKAQAKSKTMPKAPPAPQSLKQLFRDEPKPKVQQPQATIPGVSVMDGFVLVEVDKLPSNYKGTRIKFVKVEGRHKKTVGVEFSK